MYTWADEQARQDVQQLKSIAGTASKKLGDMASSFMRDLQVRKHAKSAVVMLDHFLWQLGQGPLRTPSVSMYAGRILISSSACRVLARRLRLSVTCIS
jgi:hypothetical protein